MHYHIPIYFVKSVMPDDDGNDVFIGVRHGETTFMPTTVYDQGHADRLNSTMGITREMAELAMECSMFKTWDYFHKRLESLPVPQRPTATERIVPEDGLENWRENGWTP